MEWPGFRDVVRVGVSNKIKNTPVAAPPFEELQGVFVPFFFVIAACCVTFRLVRMI